MSDKFKFNSIEMNCLLSWFPVKDSAVAKEYRTRTARFFHEDKEFLPNKAIGDSVEIRDKLNPDLLVSGISKIGLTTDLDFKVELDALHKGVAKSLELILKPDTITPFL